MIKDISILMIIKVLWRSDEVAIVDWVVKGFARV